MTHSKMTSKGQTTIPVEIREALDLRPGDRLVYRIEGKRATLTRQPGVEAVAGLLRGKLKRPLASPRQEKAAARKAWVLEAAREKGSAR